MKVAIVSIYAGLVERGAETHAWQLKKNIVHESEVFSLVNTDWTTSVPAFSEKYSGYEFWKVFVRFLRWTNLHRLCDHLPYIDCYNKESLLYLSFGCNLIKALKIYQPDIIVNFNGENIGCWLRYFRYRTGIPFVTNSGAGKNRTELRNAQSRPDVYVAETPSMKRFLQERIPRLRIELIPPGVDTQLFSPSGRKLSKEELIMLSQTPKISLEPPLVLSASAHEPNKGIERVIRAVSQLKKGVFILSGQGSLTKPLLEMAKQLLPQRFIYLGVLERNLLAAVFNSCHVYCLAASLEPFGTVLIEAMASGIPVVANNDEDRRWIVGEKGGILTDVRDVNKISKAIWEAWQTDWKNYPREQAKKFSWEQVGHKYQSLLEKIVSEKRKAFQIL